MSIDDPIRLTLISTSRADLGAQEPVLDAAKADPRFAVNLFLTGHHYGNAVIDRSLLLHNLATSKTEIVLLNGDRYEQLDIATMCLVAGLGFAHAAGGERTLGAMDDSIRDAMTKLAHLHYPVHEQAAARLRLLQEADDRICVAGEPAIDGMLRAPPVHPSQISEALGTAQKKGDVVVAVHPVTRFPEETEAIIRAIARCYHNEPERTFYFSTPNRDPGHELISGAWQALCGNGHAHLIPDRGHHFFRALVKACGILIGNSSSGLYEAPSLGAITVDIGRRQLGRVRGDSVFSIATPTAEAISAAIRSIPPSYANPYGDGNASQRILDHLWRNARRPDLFLKP